MQKSQILEYTDVWLRALHFVQDVQMKIFIKLILPSMFMVSHKSLSYLNALGIILIPVAYHFVLKIYSSRMYSMVYIQNSCKDLVDCKAHS